MNLVLADECSALHKLRGNNKFTAWRVYKMGSDMEKSQMKACVPHIDHSPSDAKVNLGFKSSLFVKTWSSLGASAEKVIEVANVSNKISSNGFKHEPQYRDSENGLEVIVYKLPILAEHANR